MTLTLASIQHGPHQPASVVAVIYEIRNTVTSKRYVGSTRRWPDRWTEHRGSLRGGKHHSVLLQRAWDKYGEGAFVCEPLASITRLHTDAELIATEQAWINMTRSADPLFGYNIAPAAGSCLGVKHGPEARANYSAAAKLRPITPEMRAKMAASRRGKRRDRETIEKTRRANIGRKQTPETKAKRRAAMLGKKPSEETRAKMRAIAKARPRERLAALHAALKHARDARRNQPTQLTLLPNPE